MMLVSESLHNTAILLNKEQSTERFQLGAFKLELEPKQPTHFILSPITCTCVQHGRNRSIIIIKFSKDSMS